MRLTRGQRGQAMVEVAVAFPLLVVVALGLVQFALYFHARNVVETAVLEAARTAAARGNPTSVGEQRGNDLAAAGWRSPEKVVVHVRLIEDGEVVEAWTNARYPTFFPAFSFSRGLDRVTLPIDVTVHLFKERFRDQR